MRLSNHVESLAQAVYSAINIYLPEVAYDGRTIRQIRENVKPVMKLRRPRTDEVEAYHFPQAWGSTALGFEGIGGQAISIAYTTVVVCNNDAAVFFDGRYAYNVTNVTTNEVFAEDVRKQNMAPVSRKDRYNQPY